MWRWEGVYCIRRGGGTNYRRDGGDGVYYVEEGYSVRPMTFNLIAFDLFIFGQPMQISSRASSSARIS